MTAVAFHFGAPHKLDYACRLLRKAVGSGSTVCVVGDAAQLRQLDVSLWAISATDFVAHCSDTADAFMQQHSPVLLAAQVNPKTHQKKVLVNLSNVIPAGFEQFERVIEIVSVDESDRNLARARWRKYAERGDQISRHDLALRGTN